MKTIVTLAMVVALSGCGLTGQQQVKTTRISVDPDTKVETTIIEEPVQQSAGGFWKSENLEEHYKFETARVDRHEKAVAKKIEAIQENVKRAIDIEGQTPTEKYMFALNANLIIDRIQTSPAPSGVKTPKTMADVAEGQLPNWLNFGLQIYDRADRRTSRGDDSEVAINNYGNGNVFYKSNKNNLSQQVAQYTLGDSEGDMEFAGSTFTPSVTSTDSNDVNNIRTDSPSTEETTLW